MKKLPLIIAALFSANAYSAAQMWCLNETTQCSYGTPSLSKLSKEERAASIYKMTVSKYNEAVNGNAFKAITANELIKLAKEYLAEPAPTPAPTPTPTEPPLDLTKLDKCADKGQDGCWFGTEEERKFYLVSGDKVETKTTSGWGTSCLVNTDYGFASTKINENDDYACYVEKGNNPAPSPAPAPAPAPSPAPVPAPTPSPMGFMPKVDTSKNMTPATGYGTLRISGLPNGLAPPSNGSVTGGDFRIHCAPSHMNNDDPIVYPNQKGAAHHHTFFGNTDTDYKSTPASLKNGGNSTCQGGIANRSSYWSPSLIDTRTNAPIKPDWALFYYKGGDVKPPEGLMMIAGEQTATKDNPQGKDHINWQCNADKLGGVAYNNRTNYIQDCSGDLTANVHFPACWDGINLDSPNHKAHMAYDNNGVCPATHPKRLPNISGIIHYNVNGTQSLRLASDNYEGGKGGYSLHMDYLFNWDPEVLDTWWRNCNLTNRDCHADIISDTQYLY